MKTVCLCSNCQITVNDVAVCFKKSCMSSILRRAVCWKTGILPEVGVLKRLVRDPKCRPVLRGIFESLLDYLIRDLLKRTTINTSTEMSSTVKQIQTRNTDQPDLQQEKKTLFLKGLKHLSYKKTPGSSFNNPEECKVDQRTGELPSRHLTKFQLLQSKFLRSSPKPFHTNQREVGTLSSCRGGSGRDNLHHNRKHKTDTRDKGFKRHGTVKEIVAKFAMAEQKQQGHKKEPLKPKHIGRGILLNSLVTRFENTASVRKKNDLPLPYEQPGGVARAASEIKEDIACVAREKQQVNDQTFDEQTLGISRINYKSVVQKTKGNEITGEQQQKPDPGADILITANSHQEYEDNLKEEPFDQEIYNSLKLMKRQADDIDFEGRASKQLGQIPNTVNKPEDLGEMAKLADLEILPLISVTEWSVQQPCEVLLQEETPVAWQVASITTCSPIWSTSVDSSPEESLKESKSEVPEGWTQLKTSRETPDSLLGKPECFSSESAEVEPNQTEGNAKSKSPSYSLEYTSGDLNLQRPKPIQGGFSKCVIPCMCRFNDETRANPIESTLHTTTSLPENQPSHSPFIYQGNDVSHSSEEITDKQICSPHSTSHPMAIIQNLKGEVGAKHKEAIEEGREDGKPSERNDICKPGGFSRLEETVNRDSYSDRESSVLLSHQFQQEGVDRKQRPKYKTINYADPSVKQTYKPKVIRFTDTFTF